jgi:hypothetical protein
MSVDARAQTWGLEPQAVMPELKPETKPTPFEIELSRAISLKRLADSLSIGAAGPTTIGDLFQNLLDRLP